MTVVSALIPSYNRAAFVGGAIETVLAQTYDDIEAVVVNDGSTDDTGTVLERYADDERVQVHHNEGNRGISASFNRAASEADGDLLCILGDDDRWHPEKVEKQVERMASSSDGCGVVYTGGVLTKGGLVTKRYRPQRRGDIYPDVLVEFGLQPHSGHMIRREAFEAVGGFDTDFPRGVDWDLAIRLARECEFEYVAEPLVNHVYHGSNVSDEPAQATVRDLIGEKYAAEIARFPEIDRRFQARRARNRTRTELKWGEWATALRHGFRGLRADPSIGAALDVALALSGPHGFRAAAWARRRLVDSMGPSKPNSSSGSDSGTGTDDAWWAGTAAPR